MTLGLAEVVAAWPLGASLAAALAAGGLREGRRRAALNEALHELRRPLQALALAVPAANRQHPARVEGPLQMAAAALERLEREINGEAIATKRESLLARPLLDAAVKRWRSRAAMSGGSLALRWDAGAARVVADRCELAQALDNLIVNAIEHGGPEVVVAAAIHSGGLRVSVVDCGRDSCPSARRESPVESLARLRGRRLRGHGLRVVRRTAAAHGGDFRLRHGDRGTEAVFELPLATVGGVAA